MYTLLNSNSNKYTYCCPFSGLFILNRLTLNSENAKKGVDCFLYILSGVCEEGLKEAERTLELIERHHSPV